MTESESVRLIQDRRVLVTFFDTIVCHLIKTGFVYLFCYVIMFSFSIIVAVVDDGVAMTIAAGSGVDMGALASSKR